MTKGSQPKKFTRRQMIGAAAALGAGGLLLRGTGARPARAATSVNNHLAWVWQFSTDSEPDVIGARLRDHGLGIILKTHDGVTWMSEYDTSDYAVSGPEQVRVLAEYFEGAGVPFHAWCVLHGRDPVKEAQFAAGVVLSGARSIYLDVEPHSGFWTGDKDDALAFGVEFRRLAPDAQVVLSIDPRPWMLDRLPLREFTAFSNAMAPQNYWRTFNTQANYDRFKETGYTVPQEGVTPEFLLTVTTTLLSVYGLPIIQVGQGATDKPDEWHRFIDGSFAGGADFVTAWRYGVMPDPVFGVLRDKPAKQPPVAPSLASYVVQAGDTLGVIAANFGTTVDAIMTQNGLSDPNYLFVGQELAIPGAGGVVQAAAVSNTAAPATGGAGQSHVVQEGDTLFAIAGQYGSSVDAIMGANGLADPNFLSIGQELHIP